MSDNVETHKKPETPNTPDGAPAFKDRQSPAAPQPPLPVAATPRAIQPRRGEGSDPVDIGQDVSIGTT